MNLEIVWIELAYEPWWKHDQELFLKLSQVEFKEVQEQCSAIARMEAKFEALLALIEERLPPTSQETPLNRPREQIIEGDQVLGNQGNDQEVQAIPIRAEA
ncbi:hypothetical protein SADUNF_Sadunf11G0057800 [Salix dunnii]|uniref:Uncharacterized protein n=1 Tax=Salix dunnii TaxID=1413687 RepID=A0A835JQ51_9ROSI|nr:hypothetical protein SADUNF_Sadunf11G0057800 [Salix dunnii]